MCKKNPLKKKILKILKKSEAKKEKITKKISHVYVFSFKRVYSLVNCHRCPQSTSKKKQTTKNKNEKYYN